MFVPVKAIAQAQATAPVLCAALDLGLGPESDVCNRYRGTSSFLSGVSYFSIHHRRWPQQQRTSSFLLDTVISVSPAENFFFSVRHVVSMNQWRGTRSKWENFCSVCSDDPICQSTTEGRYELVMGDQNQMRKPSTVVSMIASNHAIIRKHGQPNLLL